MKSGNMAKTVSTKVLTASTTTSTPLPVSASWAVGLVMDHGVLKMHQLLSFLLVLAQSVNIVQMAGVQERCPGGPGGRCIIVCITGKE